MIWEAIIKGMEILGHWQFWIASLLFTTIFIIIFLLLGLGLSKTIENQKTAVLGCVGGAILPSLLQVVFISMLVVLLLPLLMGGDDLTPLSYLSVEWWRIVKAGFFGFLALMIIALIPVIGGMATNTAGVSIFIVGMVIFHRIAGSFLRYVQEINGTNIDLKPDFWTIIGFIFLAWIIVWLFTLVIVGIFSSLKIISAEVMESGALFLGLAIGVIPGLLALSIYISYVLLKLKIAI